MTRKSNDDGFADDAPTVESVLHEFLKEERRRLGDATFRKYEDVVSLLVHCMDTYAWDGLTTEERELLDTMRDGEGEDRREFTQIFGPEHIIPCFREFLGWFMVRKVMGGKALMRAAGTVTRRLARWLEGKGYVDLDAARFGAEQGASAARDLPNAVDLALLLEGYTESARVFAEAVEGHFTFTRVETGKVWAEEFSGREYGPIRLPAAISGACPVGWSFSGRLGRRGRTWSLAEVWNVYPGT